MANNEMDTLVFMGHYKCLVYHKHGISFIVIGNVDSDYTGIRVNSCFVHHIGRVTGIGRGSERNNLARRFDWRSRFATYEIVIFCDREKAVHLINNQIYHERITKHIDVGYHFLWGVVTHGDITVKKIDTIENLNGYVD